MAPDHSSGGLTGTSVLRVEDRSLLLGAARFTDDIELDGMLHVAFHRTERPHARILQVDCSAARALAGVVEVLAHGDLDGPRELTPELRRPGLYSPPRPLLAADRVRFVGESIAVALASTRYLAEDACEAVAVDYEDLGAVAGVDAALAPDAPLLHPTASNTLLDVSYENGDVEGPLASAPIVFERTLVVGRVAAAPMEGRAVVAAPDGAGVTIWTSTQAPHQVRRALEPLLKVPVRVVCPSVGGGFGQKAHVYPEEVLIPWLALRHRRPVKWIEDRTENLLASSHARGQVVKVRVAADAGCRLLAISADVISDMGAYGVYPHGHILEALGTPNLIPGPYRLPAYRWRARAVATNKSPGGAYRGVGVAVSAFVHERVMDIIAGIAGIGPAEVRRRNLAGPSEMPYTTAAGLTYDSGDYPAALEEIAGFPDPGELSRLRQSAAERGRLLGVGISTYVETTGMGSEVFTKRGMVGITGYDDARISIGDDGGATVWTSLPSAGQGLSTSFAQLLADQLSLPLAAVRVAEVDTATVPDGTGTFGSRSAAVGGAAIMRTAEVLRDRLRKQASEQLEVAEWDLEIQDGRVFVRGSEGSSRSFGELARSAPAGFLDVTERYDPHATTFSYGSHAAVVEVDPATGGVEIVSYAITEDCGPLINPMLAAGQTHGATAQGIGAALLEAVIYNEDGQPQCGSMVDYLLPTASDIPDFRLSHLVHPSPQPGGYKGVAEGGTVAAPPAVANAVAAAIGAEVNEIPITPESVIRRLRERRRSVPTKELLEQ